MHRWMASFAVFAIFGSAVPASTHDDLDIYVAVLRFFTPPRNQVRWIEPTSPPALRDSLLHRLGTRFEGWSSAHDTDPRSGGRIRLSTIERFTPDSVRVSARYQHKTEYAVNPPFDVQFLVVKRNSKWELVKQ